MKYISSLTSSLLSVPGQRCVSILGSTGSIGTSALRVVAKNPDSFHVLALAGAKNMELLAQQAIQFRPEHVGVLDEQGAQSLASLLPKDYSPCIHIGQSGYMTLATLDQAQIILAAQVGAAGLVPALSAAQAGKVLCLANKEALVLAGHLFRQACAQSGAIILPVDSEHNALFQASLGHGHNQIARLILTASGGPFRTKTVEEMTKVTAQQALKHPNWSMGAKISIDSATMMNKGLEIIEAVQLFGMASQDINVVVHPQSIVHSLVEYTDGSQLAHLGIPDMEIPIGYCLGYPHRLNIGLQALDLAQIGTLTFASADPIRFPCLNLARQALAAGPGHLVILNATNEVAVDAFLHNRLPFLGIAQLIEHMLTTTQHTEAHNLEDILALDHNTRIYAQEALGRLNAH